MRCSVLCRQERTDSVYYQEAEPAGVQLQSGVMAVLILVMHNAALMHPSLLLCTSAAVDAHAQEQPAATPFFCYWWNFVENLCANRHHGSPSPNTDNTDTDNTDNLANSTT